MDLKKISDLFWSHSPNLFFLSIILGISTGLCHSLLIPFVIYAASTNVVQKNNLAVENYNFFHSPTSNMAEMFLITCLSIILIKFTSTMLSLYIAQKATIQHRFALYKRINLLPYASIEKIGQAKLTNLLNMDVHNLIVAASSLPIIWMSLITIIGTLGYLVYLNIHVFIFVCVSLFFAIISYQIPMLLGLRYFSKSRGYYDRIQQGVEGLVYGAKELKLSQSKSKQYIAEELIHTEQLAFNQSFKGQSVTVLAQTYGDIISFLVIGIVIFHLPYIYQITQFELFGIVMALLYLTGPVSLVLNALSNYQQGAVALKKIKEFYELSIEELPPDVAALDDWRSFRLNNVGYKYTDTIDLFELKNISIEFKRGEITFITGGNGSGKSTLSKIVSMHYQPSKGQIFLGRQKITNKNMSSMREQISAIYSDFYLFPGLHGNFNHKTIDDHLEKLELSDKIEIVNNRFNTLALSDGQKKRLALLTLLLDDKPICIFDEWASDQDPKFKSIFYNEILPELKLQGKIVIVISHDDRYFNCADQLIIMDQGSVREVIKNLK